MPALRNLLVILLCLGPIISFGQFKAEPNVIDFGVIDKNTDRVVDITLRNESNEEALILRSGFTFEYDILFSSKTISPGSSETLRVTYNPRTEGQFAEDISVWFASSQKPVILTFKGDVTYVQSNYPACPDFRERPPGTKAMESFLAEVYDIETGKSIRDARLRIVENGVLQKTLFTDRSGEAELNVPIGYYFLIADAPGYFPADTASYVNRRNNFFRIGLQPMEIVQNQSESESERETETEREMDEDTVSIRIEFNKDESESQSERERERESEFLPESQFNQNNIVFLIDVSHSMNQKGKLDLLKASMLELTSVLRDVDKVSVITYAANPVVIVKGKSGSDKGEISQSITELEAGGMTAGARGFKKAYEMARGGFLDDGNNQVIVATDGAFRSTDNETIMKLARKNTNKGIKTSVVGIRSNVHATKKLTEIAELGEGSFIMMEDYDRSLDQLIEEIKLQSRKN